MREIPQSYVRRYREWARGMPLGDRRLALAMSSFGLSILAHETAKFSQPDRSPSANFLTILSG
ncbi:MAG TPA: hypothetical protein VFV61_02965 [Pyrinomonadaceae bacterium]|nr:hypothetical protein [Pyrinomonadaceae bacterium]